jgi:hypothetical protein
MPSRSGQEGGKLSSNRSAVRGIPAISASEDVDMHAVRFVVSRGAVALVILLNGCGGGAVTGTGGIAAPPVTNLGISPEPRKGPGVYGVGFEDQVAIDGVSKYDSEFVKKEEVEDRLSFSRSNSSVKLVATAALGSLTGSSTIIRRVVGAYAVTAITWEDTFTITSKKLKANTPVNFKATLKIDGKPVACMGNGSGYFWAVDELSITTRDWGLEYVSQCGPPQEVLKATVKTYVGASFTESGTFDTTVGVDPYNSSCPSCKPDFKYESGPVTATYHLDPITPGASYITASGKSYL